MFSPYPRNEILTAIFMGYKNGKTIADRVLPRTSAIGSTKFKYQVYQANQFAHVPDTHVGRRTAINEVEFSGEERHAEIGERALSHVFVPRDFVGVADPDKKKAAATAALADIMSLAREQRVAKLVFDPANYGLNFALANGNDYFDDEYTDPVKVIRTAIAAPLIKPNVMTLGRKEWYALATHPRILAAVTRAQGMIGSIGAAGIATLDEVARLFELDEVLVGEALIANKSDASGVLKPIWSGNVSFTYRDMSAIGNAGQGFGNNLTFGFTAHNDQYVNSYHDDKQGTQGVEVVRAVSEDAEIICAPNAGFLLQGVLSA